MPKITLRSYQQEGVNDVRKAFSAGHRAVCYVLPTGGGKSVLLSFISKSADQKGHRVLLLVHRQELLMQLSDHLSKWDVNHGLIAPRFSPTGDRVQIGSVQTVVRRLGKIPRPDLIIADETHHIVSGSWSKIIGYFQGSAFLGVTATPNRLDGKGLGKRSGGPFDIMVQGPNIQDLINAGHLCKPRVYGPVSEINLAGIKKSMGDFDKKQLSSAIDKPMIVGSSVEHYKKICPGVSTVVFCVSIAHAEHVAAEFRAAGFSSDVIHGGLDYATRKKMVKNLETGALQVMVSVDVVSEGFDCPVIECGILLRPTQSESLFLQQTGRILRTKEGKGAPVLLDHVGNCLRHGMPDEIREWSLDGEDRKRASRGSQDVIDRVKQCERCYAVHPPAPKCPHCGFVYEADARDIEQVDGELQEIDEQQAEFLRRQRRSEVGRAKTLEDLQAIAKARGYKPGWARHIWKARQKRRA